MWEEEYVGGEICGRKNKIEEKEEGGKQTDTTEEPTFGFVVFRKGDAD